jgi:hypothetical protein
MVRQRPQTFVGSQIPAGVGANDEAIQNLMVNLTAGPIRVNHPGRAIDGIRTRRWSGLRASGWTLRCPWTDERQVPGMLFRAGVTAEPLYAERQFNIYQVRGARSSRGRLGIQGRFRPG